MLHSLRVFSLPSASKSSSCLPFRVDHLRMVGHHDSEMGDALDEEIEEGGEERGTNELSCCVPVFQLFFLNG